MADFSEDFSEDFDIEEEEPAAPPTTPHKITGTLLWVDAPHRPHRRP